MLAELLLLVYWFLSVLSFFVFLSNVLRQVGFWRLLFMAVLLGAVTLHTDIAILDVQNVSFGLPAGSNLAPWGPFSQLGDTLGGHGEAGRTRGGPEPDFE